MKKGWLVNDTLTCIPNTKTFWHNLLDWLPELIDKTNGLTPFGSLPGMIEKDAQLNGTPDYIIRNCTFFREMNIKTKTISLLQDCYTGNKQQIDVANSSDMVVFNSPFTRAFFGNQITAKYAIIPLGVDSDSFTQHKTNYREELGILPDSILFVGANNNHPKGFDLMLDIINNTDYNFCLVMKDGYTMNHPRVKVFNRVNQDMIIKIYNSCKMVLCTSRIETLHLGGIEGGMCGLPIVATNVGVYHNIGHGDWGRKASNIEEFKGEIKYIFENYTEFNPRKYFIEGGYDINSTKIRWQKLINNINE